jgi:hypothetical protein
MENSAPEIKHCLASTLDDGSEEKRSMSATKMDGTCISDTEHVDEAPSILVNSNSCDNDNDIFECGICTEDLKVPKSLPCLHNFCQECLQKYFSANSILDGQKFQCPTCRAPVSIPKGGAQNFPTNFHIVNLRKQSHDLDMGQTIKEAVQYLEYRAEEIVEELTERKRQVLISVSKRRSDLMARIEDMTETLLENVEEQYTTDSTKSVEVINIIKSKLSELQIQLETTYSERKSQRPKNPEAIRLNALTKLRRQAEIISNVNNELEELKLDADHALSRILAMQVAFYAGTCSREDMKRSFGKLIILSEGQTLEQVKSQEHDEEGFSPLHVKSWSQSWWVLVFAVLPAVICALLVKLILTFFEKLLG